MITATVSGQRRAGEDRSCHRRLNDQDSSNLPALASLIIESIESTRASTEVLWLVQPRPRSFDVSNRTTGTSPFQPRRPPPNVYLTPGDAQAFHDQVGDLADGDIIFGGDIENVEAPPSVVVEQEQGIKDVVNVNV